MLLSPWPALESLPDLNAVPAVWRRLLGQHFEPFRRTFLQPKPEPARSIPCDHCACAHEIIHQPNNSPPETRNTEHETRIQHPSLLAICRCSPWTCPNLHLSPADIILLELSWPKLARALCRALGLNSHFADVRLHQTFQIGSWSAAAVSAILTIQSDPHEFRRVVAELVARLRQPFILLAPTTTHLDASCAELLACAQAGFFGLDSHVRLSEHGTLQPSQTPGELFAKLTPQPAAPPDEDVARQAFALLQKLDAKSPGRPPSPLTVFRLYCVEELTAAQIARKCRCSKTTVIDRLKLIRAATGMRPEELRRVSTHFAKIEADLRDSRAEHIHRKNLLDEPGSEEHDE